MVEVVERRNRSELVGAPSASRSERASLTSASDAPSSPAGSFSSTALAIEYTPSIVTPRSLLNTLARCSWLSASASTASWFCFSSSSAAARQHVTTAGRIDDEGGGADRGRRREHFVDPVCGVVDLPARVERRLAVVGDDRRQQCERDGNEQHDNRRRPRVATDPLEHAVAPPCRFVHDALQCRFVLGPALDGVVLIDVLLANAILLGVLLRHANLRSCSRAAHVARPPTVPRSDHRVPQASSLRGLVSPGHRPSQPRQPRYPVRTHSIIASAGVVARAADAAKSHAFGTTDPTRYSQPTHVHHQSGTSALGQMLHIRIVVLFEGMDGDACKVRQVEAARRLRLCGGVLFEFGIGWNGSSSSRIRPGTVGGEENADVVRSPRCRRSRLEPP